MAALPTALRKQSEWVKFRDIPVLLAPPPNAEQPAPVVIWMHGRTVTKEIDPGRYLRWIRHGIAACAVDLPGHGERFDRELQHPSRTWDVVKQMREEIDLIVDALSEDDRFDMTRIGIGGMSAGGMATISRLCDPHPFVCASVEATTGSWSHQQDREMFEGHTPAEVARLSPINNLSSTSGGWREIPFQAIHCRADEWVKFEGQQAFIDALRDRYEVPDIIELVAYDKTGAPYEHAGFGRYGSDAKNKQLDFFQRHVT